LFASRPAIHALADFDIDVVMVDEFGELIFIDDCLLWDQLYVDAQINRSFKWSVEVEVFYICCHEPSSGFENNTVEKQFDCC
jgi:hypothetical protein